MPIRVQCICGELIDAPERLAGREVRCPRCNRLVLVPGAAAQARPTVVFSLAVLAGIAITLGLVLLPGWLARVGRSGAADLRICAGNLRALGTAIRAYAEHHDGWMPSSWDNTFALIAPYLAPGERKGPDAVWRCPSDPFWGGNLLNHCSYGVNADETDGGPDDGNRFHPGEPFAQAGLGPGPDIYPGPFAHRVRGRGERQVGVRIDPIPPRTILMIENWSPLNTLDLDDPRRPNRAAPPDRARLAILIREYARWRKPRFDARRCLVDAGSYLFLKPYEGRNIPLGRMYHHGRLHVLYADGRVELVPIRRLLEPRPAGFAPADPLRGFLDGPPWTRLGRAGS